MPTAAEEAAQVLSKRNGQTYQLAWQVHSTRGACLTDAMRSDRLLMQNVGLVLRLIESFERSDLAERIGREVGPEVARFLR